MEQMIIVALHMFKSHLRTHTFIFSMLDHDDVSKYLHCEIFNVCFCP